MADDLENLGHERLTNLPTTSTPDLHQLSYEVKVLIDIVLAIQQ
jgi:hypothetical protein